MIINLTPDKKEILEKYMEGILEWNEKVNLTNITEPEEFRVKHIMDSLMCTDFPEYIRAESIIDVGTGGGFPGIPLAVFSPEKSFTLLDSLNKRLKIIGELSEELGISNIRLLHGRAEDMGRAKEHRGKYDLCVSRAVSNLATLSEYCLPFIKTGGFLLAYKGPGASKEVEEAKGAIRKLGGEFLEIRDIQLEEYGLDHKIVVIRKDRPTPKAYPRKAGTPLKEPLK